MKAIILAGGRGKRLGALTKKSQKATLSFKGLPLICYTLNNLTDIGEIEKIFVLTGYRGEDVHLTVLSRFSEKRIKMMDFPFIRGNLSRLAAALTQIDIADGCFLCGIDSLIPAEVIQRFWRFSRNNRNRPLLLLSPHLKVAPTHGLVFFHDGLAADYQNLERSKEADNCRNDYYVDTGIRYFPESFCETIKEEEKINGQYIPLLLEKFIKKGQQVGGLIFTESWRHFSAARDFSR